MESSNKTNIYLMILIALNIFLALAVSLLFLDFKNNRLTELDRLNSELALLQGLETKTRSVDQIISESKEERNRLNFYFITKETIPNFIEELESVAGQSDILFNLENIEVKKETKQPNKGSYLRFTLKSEGSFVNVFHFLKALENLPYQVRLNTVNISKLAGEDVNGVDRSSFWQGRMTADLMSYVDK